MMKSYQGFFVRFFPPHHFLLKHFYPPTNQVKFHCQVPPLLPPGQKTKMTRKTTESRHSIETVFHFPPQKGGNSFHLWPQHAFQSPHLATNLFGRQGGLGKEGRWFMGI